MLESGINPPINRRLVKKMASQERRTRRLYVLSMFTAIAAAVIFLVAGEPFPSGFVAFSVFWLIGSVWAFSHFHAAGQVLGSTACRICGYDLAGVGDNHVCPECGSDAGMMRCTIEPDAEKRAARDARICRVTIPLLIVLAPLGACPIFVPSILDPFVNDGRIHIIVVPLAMLYTGVSYHLAFYDTGRRIRNIARWRRYQSDMAREHADAAPA